MAKANAAESKMIKLKLVKSLNGRKQNHIACAHGLGLRKIGQISEVIDTPENRGMVNTIPYLLSVQD